MHAFFPRCRKDRRNGFNLVEATLSLGVLSLGLMTLAPIMTVGLKAARCARSDQGAALVAETLVEKARQGTLTPGTDSYDQSGTACDPNEEAYTTQSALSSLSASLTRVTLTVTPVGAPERAQTYVVLVTPSS